MRKLLIANRGEIAVRIARAAREQGIATVAVYSAADKDAEHVRAADECVLVGPAPATASYLNVAAIMDAVRESGADAVHPGYGFLSENADFAQAVLDAGAVWVGPSPTAIREMGDKVAARKSAEAAGVPTVPGSPGEVHDAAEAEQIAQRTGFPLAIKAAAGGGGRGIRIVERQEDLAAAISTAQAEARAAFGSDAVYVERFIPRARHIEVQIFGDGTNFVHLGLRDCSMQRRRQKVIEEAGELGLPAAASTGIAESAVQLAASVGYTGAGTVEFLYDEMRGEFYFIEMNTRIQVEHPVTEMIYQRDLVGEQLRVAAGAPLSFRQEELVPAGHAIEVRINAENPAQNFLPSPGAITRFDLPAGPFVRVDSGFKAGSVVAPFYDSMLAKVIVWGEDRPRALARLGRALDELVIEGVTTTADFVAAVLATDEFRTGRYHTTWLEGWLTAREQARTETADA
ncbi:MULTISPECIES: acetyl-CoA carboxylase biotin carboxylase subunit [Nocardia]|uniref:acetyl-CoA carboxylase biotin carboxylase subunit n=1 Tax=Nocardia TaxID=1817 RepID=UPI000BEF8F96|nr:MULTISPECIES: acetyl-CoA carboxylase biotin carboxylase subunit [Nocardia]MBF6185685.1 acetyl-CoA carboxylase biotin carboxylase subunit [Nocardia farcinica]MBF6311530.1 acetyl-CoA carboxylase biotin carboxylase subunit [Nocardia farcinica]MBF6408514.1 acetyl-CoA carboxylase biotin carboxylase subunit [Nocardia farcinica]PEH76729.1 acetyl-CoA carboxylase biotin carboxylase subunit [Nocardia sp. FDAARGOS_372]UEX21122.1 acetyl-CoA carboxylase biotin carboxylase subunit [Nocardia farcinica]